MQETFPNQRYHLQKGSHTFKNHLTRFQNLDYVLIDMHILPSDASYVFLHEFRQYAPCVPYIVVGHEDLPTYYPFLSDIGISYFVQGPWTSGKLHQLFLALADGTGCFIQ
ncbi:MAG: hypothetical protein Phog2KO_47840 [Phototrophicaceae bacterium]